MTRFDATVGVLVDAGYSLEQARVFAAAEEQERQTDALVRIADALERAAEFSTGERAAAILAGYDMRIGMEVPENEQPDTDNTTRRSEA